MYESADDVMRAEALFASDLQESDSICSESVVHTVERVLDREGPGSCAARMAYEFGEHPDAAARRMAWARHLISKALRSSPTA